MSLQRAVLGEIIERPGYGYELTYRLQERIVGARLSETSVYPALKRLEKKQYVRVRCDAGERRVQPAHRDVVRYEATDAGRQYFEEWFEQPLELAPLRDELRLRIAFAKVEDLPRLMVVIDEFEQTCVDRMQELTGPAGASGDEMRQAGADWRLSSQIWLRHSEIAHLSTSVETLHHARWLMMAAIREHQAQARPD
jgi:DNA-binding PadR family transcriptional regulator